GRCWKSLGTRVLDGTASVPARRRRGDAGGADLRFVRGIDRIKVLRRGKAAGTYVVGVCAERMLDLEIQVGVPPNESGVDLADEAAEYVVRDDELAVHVRPRADAVNEQVHALTDIGRR